MLKNLHIQNYRLFEDFKIEGLGQVNLIAGKNNTGKTALLGALRILVSKGNITVINNIIKARGQFTPSWKESYESLFNWASIPENGKPLEIAINNLQIGRSVNRGGKPNYHGVYSGGKNKETFELNPNESPDFPHDWVVYVPFSNNNFPLNKLWEKIALTDDEDNVVLILKILEKDIDRVDVLESGARVKLANVKNPLPLSNLGEGATRLLALSLALISAKNKLLLIDEFESGLHYSVQEQLWDIVFEYAKKWDIQVFATTHSMDTVKAFYYVQEKKEYDGLGKFYRLQRSRKGDIEAITYDENKLEFALEHQLDPR